MHNENYLIKSDTLEDIADAIREKTENEELIAVEDFANEISNIPSGTPTQAIEKDVNFYDFTGFRWYSYSRDEFLELESMPENPEIEGLTPQGWNWSYQDTRDYVTRYGKLDIGQMYVTDDGATRLYVELDKMWLTPTLQLGVNGTVEIDWGDGSSRSTITGSNYNTTISTQHIYSKSGGYVISIYPIGNAQISFTANNQPSTILGSDNYGYVTAIKRVEFGTNIASLNACFRKCHGLTEISLPNTITSIPNYMFQNCRGLKCLIVPSSITSIGSYVFEDVGGAMRFIFSNSVTSIGSSVFRWCFGMPNIYIPSNPNLTTLPGSLFNSCHTITSLIFPKNITSLSSSPFNDCPSIRYLDFSGYETIPTITSSSLNNTNNAKIIVPDDLYDTWKTTSGWSNYSSRIIKKSDWNLL